MTNNRHFLFTLLIIAIALLLSGCSEQKSGLEAVYDSERFRLSLSQQELVIYDRALKKNIFKAKARDLLEAHKTALGSAPNDAYPKESYSRSCSNAVIEKAEPYSAYFLLVGRFDSPGCDLRFYLRFAVSEHSIHITAYTNDENYNHLTLGYSSSKQESIHGFGVQYSKLDFKGSLVPIWIQRQGIGRGEQPISAMIESYVPGVAGNQFSSAQTFPYFLSSQHYTVFLENMEFSRFDFRQHDKTFIHVYSPSLKLQLNSCAKLLNCIAQFSEISGRMKTLPAWAHKGAIVGLQGGSESLLHNYHTLKEQKAQISAVVIGDWTGTYLAMQEAPPLPSWNWETDTTLYPDWAQLVNELKADGVRLIGYFNPFLVDTSSLNSEINSLYQQARDKHFLVTAANGKPYQLETIKIPASMIDLSNPSAFKWYKNIIKQKITEHQFSGWIADFGENLPIDAQLKSPLESLSYHHQYVQDWARLNREIIDELSLPQERLFMMRSGYSQTAGLTPLFWLDYQNTSWDANDGLQSAVIGLINSGMSGIGINHSETGGYTSMQRRIPAIADLLVSEDLIIRSRDGEKNQAYFALRRRQNLLQRWIEFSTFTPVFRTGEGLTAEINAQIYDPQSIQHFARFSKLFAALFPYRNYLMQQHEEKGWPMVRHPIVHYPDDQRFLQMANNEAQFMLGESIMVAPKLTPRNEKEARVVILPEGEWLELWSGIVHRVDRAGITLKVVPAIGEPPVYLLNNEITRTLILPALHNAGFIPVNGQSPKINNNLEETTTAEESSSFATMPDSG